MRTISEIIAGGDTLIILFSFFFILSSFFILAAGLSELFHDGGPVDAAVEGEPVLTPAAARSFMSTHYNPGPNADGAIPPLPAFVYKEQKRVGGVILSTHNNPAFVHGGVFCFLFGYIIAYRGRFVKLY